MTVKDDPFAGHVWKYVDTAGALTVLDPALCVPRASSGARLRALEVLLLGGAGDLLLLLYHGPVAAAVMAGAPVEGAPGIHALEAVLRAPPAQFSLPASPPQGQRLLLDVGAGDAGKLWRELDLHSGDCLAWWYPPEGAGPRVPYCREGRRPVLWQAVTAPSEVGHTSVFQVAESRAYAARMHLDVAQHISSDGPQSPEPPLHLPLTFKAFLATQPVATLGHAVTWRGSSDTARDISFVDMCTCGSAHRGFLRTVRFYGQADEHDRSFRLQVYRRLPRIAVASRPKALAVQADGAGLAVEFQLRGQTRELPANRNASADGGGVVEFDISEDLLWFHGPTDCLGWHHAGIGIFPFEEVSTPAASHNTKPLCAIRPAAAADVRWRRGPLPSVGASLRFKDGAASRMYSLSVGFGEPSSADSLGDSPADVGVDDSIPEECRHSLGELCCVDDRTAHVVCTEHSTLQIGESVASLGKLCSIFSEAYGGILRPLHGPFDHCRVALPAPPLLPSHQAGPQPRKVFAMTFATDLALARAMLASAAKWGVPMNVRGPLALCSANATDAENCLLHMYRSTDAFVASLHPLDMVLRLDAYDAMLLTGITTIVSDFLAGMHELLFSAERYCVPDPILEPEFEEVETPFRFLSSGALIGYAYAFDRMHRAIAGSFQDVRQCGRIPLQGVAEQGMDRAIDYTSEEVFSSQRCYQWYYLTHRHVHRVGIDSRQWLAAEPSAVQGNEAWMARPAVLHRSSWVRWAAHQEDMQAVFDAGAMVVAPQQPVGIPLFRPSEDRRRSSQRAT